MLFWIISKLQYSKWPLDKTDCWAEHLVFSSLLLMVQPCGGIVSKRKAYKNKLKQRHGLLLV